MNRIHLSQLFALVLMTSDADTLAAVQAALGVG